MRFRSLPQREGACRSLRGLLAKEDEGWRRGGRGRGIEEREVAEAMGVVRGGELHFVFKE